VSSFYHNKIHNIRFNFSIFLVCLIATSNPLEYCKTHLYPVVDKLKDKIDVKNIHKKYEIYLGELSKYNENVEKIKAKFTAVDKIDEEVNKLKIPKLDFLKSLQINTELHINSFAKYVKAYDISMLKKEPYNIMIPENFERKFEKPKFKKKRRKKKYLN
jgi:hypothetical protein